jgi:hypothetical protein
MKIAKFMATLNLALLFIWGIFLLYLGHGSWNFLAMCCFGIVTYIVVDKLGKADAE